jgi:hypothetical protein
MKTPIAYEFHNCETGHCYVDYIERNGLGKNQGYTKIPLFKEEKDEPKMSADKILQEELSTTHWEIITKQDEEGHTTFKDWIIETMDRYANQFKQ